MVISHSYRSQMTAAQIAAVFAKSDRSWYQKLSPSFSILSEFLYIIRVFVYYRSPQLILSLTLNPFQPKLVAAS